MFETQSNGATEKVYPDADITNRIIGCAIEVHKALGPGLLESVYESCLSFELSKAGLRVDRQKALPVTYKGLDFEEGFRIDLLIEEKVVVELKCVEKILPIHEAQIYTYLKLSGNKIGLLINFNSKMLKDGIIRIAC
jgi:GxxExxY protein